MGAAEEDLVRGLLEATEGGTQDVDAMTALMTDDFVWQINVPLAKVIVGRAAARTEIERQNKRSTGLRPGSEIRTVVSNGQTVFTERLDVVQVAGKTVSIHINGIFEIRDGKIAAWREYFDGVDLARQLGVDPKVLYLEVG